MADTRAAVYFDFDNIVISRYDELHGRGAWRSDGPGRSATVTPAVRRRLTQARVDVGAIIDYATSFGTVAFTRAYADWSNPANAAYRDQLVDRSVDLVQLFHASGTKNGADIRLSIDAVDDLFRHPDLTHVVIVAGDSDYVSLAQRCKRLGRFVVGVGVAGGTSRALVAACDEFTSYADLPSLADQAEAESAEEDGEQVESSQVQSSSAPSARPGASTGARESGDRTGPSAEPDARPGQNAQREQQPEPDTQDVRRTAKPGATKEKDATGTESLGQKAASRLLMRAIAVQENAGDEWIHLGQLKTQMTRLDPAFKEKPLGYSSFRKFLESRSGQLELRQDEHGVALVRRRTS